MKPNQILSLAFVALSFSAIACGSSEESTSSQDNAQIQEAPLDATPDGPLPTCAAKGGKCGAVVPGACTDGTVDPNVSDCGSGQVGASCCIPKKKQPEPPKPSCASVGGACTPVVPGACADGTIDPNVDCGGVGAACCVPKPKPKPSCASLGGTCTAVVPGACANGTIDANADCGGGVGVSCCIAGDGG